MVLTFPVSLSRRIGKVANCSNLSLTKRLCSKWGSSKILANLKAFTGFDRGLQV